MKGLRRFLDRIKPDFEPGGRFGRLHSTFDAFETFLFVPDKTTHSGSHIRDAMDLKRTMIIVVLALMPCLLFGMYNVGLQHFRAIGVADAALWSCFWFGFLKVLPIIIVSYVVGLGIEFISAQIRGHEVNEGFLVTGMLIPLVMPVDIPLWMVAVATAFSVIIGKEVFGGTGMNIFNPALLARAFVFFAYTPYISGEKVWIAGLTKGEGIVDGFSGATPLGDAASAVLNHTKEIIWTQGGPLEWFLGTMPGSIGETSKLAILIGAVILLVFKVIDLRIPLSCLLSFSVFAILFGGHGFDLHFLAAQLCAGGLMLGTFFMATDYVTSPITKNGQIVYGCIIGIFTGVFRFLGSASEGVSYAIILSNLLVPLIEKVTPPTAFGKGGKKHE